MYRLLDLFLLIELRPKVIPVVRYRSGLRELETAGSTYRIRSQNGALATACDGKAESLLRSGTRRLSQKSTEFTLDHRNGSIPNFWLRIESRSS